MLVIEHRINTVQQLSRVPSFNGVEIDLRSHCDKIILNHDPFQNGELLEDWLQFWRGQFLVLNIKEEGIEDHVLRIINKYEIQNYFLLDQSFPFLQKTIKSGNRNVAVRVSDLEGIDTVLRTNSNWVWIDCFNGDWAFLPDVINRLTDLSKKTCLVSPELVRQDTSDEICKLMNIIKNYDLAIDAVCTKNPVTWTK